MEGDPLFLPALKRLKTLYPKAYTRGTTSTSDGADYPNEVNMDVKLSARIHPGDAGLDSFLGGGDPSPTLPLSLVGAPIDILPVTRKTWMDRGSTYRRQGKCDLSSLAGAETPMDGVVVGSVGATETPPPSYP